MLINRQILGHVGETKFFGNALISMSRTQLHSSGKKAMVPVIYALHITPFFAIGFVALKRFKEKLIAKISDDEFEIVLPKE